MAVSWVTTSSGNNASTGASISSPTANHLLVFGVVSRSNATLVTPSGWEKVDGTNYVYGNNLSVALYYKVSDGTESAVADSGASNSTASSWVFAEISGLATSSPLDTSSANFSGASASSSVTYGTSTPTEQPGLAIALTTWGVGSSGVRISSYGASLVEQVMKSSGSYGQAISLASQEYSSLSSISPTTTLSGSQRNNGILALFKEPSISVTLSSPAATSITATSVVPQVYVTWA